MNLAGFTAGLVSDHWRTVLWIAIGAVLCWPVASCQGKREANAAMRQDQAPDNAARSEEK